MGLRIKTRIPPPVYGLITAAAMWGLGRWLPLATLPAALTHLASIPLAPLVAVIGASLDFIALGFFLRARTTINPLRPDKTQALVTHGIYRLSRNPMYLGMLIMLAAWGLHLASLSPFLMLPVFVFVVNEMQIKPEEASLKNKFNEAYQSYCQRVRRWI